MHADGHAVVVSLIQTPKRIAATVLQCFDEAVPRATPWVGLHGITAALLEQPDRLQVALSPE